MSLARIGWIGIALGALCSSAGAQSKAAAREAYLEGSKLYDLNHYGDALKAFERAYWNYEDPSFLYNIGQCHRALGHKKEAVDFYRSYLRKAANAPNRQDVERVIAELQSAIDKEKKAVVIAPPSPAVITTEVSPPTVAPPPPTTPVRSPAWKRPWLWGAVGGVVAVGIGLGVGLGVGLQPHPPTATDGAVRF
jgi:tetratricopeptide (TPR) repeat protein